jgi:hypothetical protein
MPYGSGQVVRMALIHAKPWQRYAICGAMIVGGVALAVVGHIAGILLSAAGFAMAWKMISYRRPQATSPGAPPLSSTSVQTKERGGTDSRG